MSLFWEPFQFELHREFFRWVRLDIQRHDPVADSVHGNDGAGFIPFVESLVKVKAGQIIIAFGADRQPRIVPNQHTFGIGPGSSPFNSSLMTVHPVAFLN